MGNENYKILLADDEPDVLEFLSYNLKREGYQVLKAKNGTEAVEIARTELPQLIILDVMMPHMDGITACREIQDIPQLDNSIVVFLTARSEDYSQLAGFEAGADDYISKPIEPRVLISRVKALLKRYKAVSEAASVAENDIIIDREKFVVIKDGKEILLPKKEFELLELLVSRPNKVYTREEIFAQVWGNDVIVGDRTIDVHVRKIREKIGIANIKTIKGVGYKYESV